MNILRALAVSMLLMLANKGTLLADEWGEFERVPVEEYNTDVVMGYYRLSNSILECAAIYDLFSALALEEGLASEAQVWHETGNGAEITAATLMMMTGSDKENAFELAKSKREGHNASIGMLVGRGEFDKIQTIVTLCNEFYRPIQNSITEALQAYLASGSSDPKLLERLIDDAFDNIFQDK